MQRAINQPIRGSDPGNFALFDQISSAIGFQVGPGWSPGAQRILSVPPAQVPDGKWKILGYGFMFSGVLFNIKNTLNSIPLPCFAKLGKLYGGLILDGGLSEAGAVPFQQLPTDRTMIDLLWNGKTDEPWPQGTSLAPFKAGAQSMQVFSRILPAPVDVGPEDSLQIGLWLTPMLGQNVGIWIINAEYTVLYDNLLPG